jgi:hypothetical protein
MVAATPDIATVKAESEAAKDMKFIAPITELIILAIL